MEQKDISEQRYIKLLSSEGIGYENTELKAIKTLFENSKGETQFLPLTPRACLNVPYEDGIIQVVDSRNGESLTKAIKKETTWVSLITLNLAPKPEDPNQLTVPRRRLFCVRLLVSTPFAGHLRRDRWP
jgi:hypothetical protein